MRPTDLLRAATAVALRCGWEVHEPAIGQGDHPSAEVRLVVSGSGLPGPCLLRVRLRPVARGPAPDVAARRAAACEHVVGVVEQPPVSRVRGIGIDAVLLGHAQGGSLEALLAAREGLRGGEAATILLGVASALRSLHSAGWSGPELTPAGVVFVGDGCPALDELDHVAEWTPAAAVDDADAFYALAHALCLRVADGSGMELLSAVEAGLRRGNWSAVEESVLRTIAPQPVHLTGRPRPEGAGGVAASGGVAPEGSVASAPRGRWRRAGLGGTLGSVLGSAMDALDGSPGRSLLQWLRGRLRRRPALVAIALAPVVAALALIVLLPVSPAESASAAGKGRPAARATGTPTPSRTAVAAPPGPAPSEVSGEDPVDAARAVLDGRLDCFRARPAEATCLDDLLDGTSALVGEEAAALGVAGAADARDYANARLSLLESWGAAALVSVVPDAARTPKSKPASLLLVRSEAGWRLREVFP